jgi:hypothetical protein
LVDDTICSEESDPIQSVSAEIPLGYCHKVSDFEGIELEVVLSNSTDAIESQGVVEPSSQVSIRHAGESGLSGFLTTNPCQPSSVALVEKARGDAQHVIDIQEDIGMNFKGEGDDDVVRSMLCEDRDREKKMVWVQSEGNQ